MSTTDTTTTGVMGVPVAVGDHLCAFYPSLADRNEILIPYLQQGMQAGDKCVCIVTHDMTETELESVRSLSRHDNQLTVDRSDDTYLRDGNFSSERMLDYWDSAISQSIKDGFTFSRVAGEMTWALENMPGVENLVSYEAQLNPFLRQHRAVIVCLYEIGRFGGDILVGILKTHPKVILGGIVLDNPYYVDPTEYLAARGVDRG